MKKLLTFLTLLTLSIGVGWAATVTDVLTITTTGINGGGGYANWSGKTSNSTAIYAGNSGGGQSATNPSIQIRTTNSNSGIITTASGGTVKKVSITFNSYLSQSRTVNVYGKNSAYTAATDLYGDNAGTLVGTLTGTGSGNTKTVELTVSGNYSFIGLCSNNGAIYIDEIQITWETGGVTVETVATPTFSPAAGTYTSAQNVAISCSTSGATIHYTTDGTTPTTSSPTYSSEIPVSSTTTIKAMAVKSGMNNSNVATATYTIDTPADGDYIKVTSSDALTSGEYLIVYEEGSVAFNGNLTTLDAVGNKINVTISNNKIAADETVDNAIFTYDATAKTLRSHSGYYIGQTEDANGMASNTTTTYENTISFDNGNANIVSGGAYLRYNSASNQTRFRYFKSSTYTSQKAIQLYKKIVSVQTPTISGSIQFVGSTTVTITCAATGATIYYTTDGTNPTNASTPYTGPFELTFSATVKAIAYVGTNASSVASMEFVKIPTVANVNEILSLNDGDIFYYSGTLIAIAQTGSHLYAQDANGKGLYLYGATGQTYNKEEVIPAGWTGKYTANYHGALEITEMTGMQPKSGTSELIAQEITPNEVTATNPYNLFHYAVIDGATIDGNTITAGGQSIEIYNRFNVDIPTDNKVYYVYGIPSLYNNKQFLPLEFVEKISGEPTYFLYGSFNNWSQTDGTLQFIDNGNGTFTLNNANLPDNVRFKIVKKHGNALLGDYGAANWGNDYGINGGWHSNIPMNGADAYTIMKGGATSFVINSSEMKFDVSRENKMSLRTSADNWVEHAMTQTENGWTITKEMTKGEQFEFADAWAYFGNDWWIQPSHLGNGIALLTNEGKHFQIDIDGTAEYKFVVNNDKNQVVINRAYAINTSVVTDPVDKVGGTIVAKIDDQTVTKAYPGETVTLAITTNSGYELTSVTLNGTAIEPVEGVYSFVMPSADANVVANFVAKSYPITVTEVDGTGVVDIPTSATTGQTVNFTVTPPEGYTIISVTASFTNNNGGTTAITVSENEGTYSFGMPPFPVTVTVTYEAPAVTLNPPMFAPDPDLYSTIPDYVPIEIGSEYEDGIIYYLIDPETVPTANDVMANGESCENGAEVYLGGAGEHTIYAVVEVDGVLSPVATATYTIYQELEWKQVPNPGYINPLYDYIIVNSDHTMAIGSYDNNGHFNAVACENNITFDPYYLSATVNSSDVKVFNVEVEDIYEYYFFLKDASTYYSFGNEVGTSTTGSRIYFNFVNQMMHSNCFLSGSQGGSYLSYGADNFGIYSADGSPIQMYYRPKDSSTLAEIAEYDPSGAEITISDELVVVKSLEIKDGVLQDITDGALLFCKDLGKAYDMTENPDPENIEDYMKVSGGFSGDWDQSNWIALVFNNVTQQDWAKIQSYEGKHIQAGTLTGSYSSDEKRKHLLFMNTTDLVEAEGSELTNYNTNLYCPANFLPSNLNGNATGHGDYADRRYFFVNPKVEEYCEITFAVWKPRTDYGESGGYFTLPKPDGENNITNIYGAAVVDWSYNELGNVSDIMSANPGQAYKFKAIVENQHSGSKSPLLKDGETVEPQEDSIFPMGTYAIFPVDFNPENEENIVTSIDTVNRFAGNSDVKSIKYVNVAGMVSDKPFQGMNIVVVENTDGSKTTYKMISK